MRPSCELQEEIERLQAACHRGWQVLVDRRRIEVGGPAFQQCMLGRDEEGELLCSAAAVVLQDSFVTEVLAGG